MSRRWGEQLLGTLLGVPNRAPERQEMERRIGVGAALFPIDAYRMHAAGLAGVITEHGGKTSHLAILLRALEMPYVAGVAGLLRVLEPGTLVIIDGARGDMIVEPDEPTLKAFDERKRRRLERARRLRSAVARPCHTQDGVRVEVGANIEALAEIPRAIEQSAPARGRAPARQRGRAGWRSRSGRRSGPAGTRPGRRCSSARRSSR
jgi:phosphoenolpyruvate-protein kinase (PTS system EI component)